MGHVTSDRISESTNTAGTGSLALTGAATSFLQFSTGMSIGDTCDYLIEETATGAWERGIGTYSAVNTLARSLTSSSTGALISLAAGSTGKYVSIPSSLAMAVHLPEYTGDSSTTPEKPNLGLRLYARKRAGRRVLHVRDGYAAEYALQSHLSKRSFCLYQAIGNGTGVTLIGTVDNVTGTATARNVATTNRFTATKRKGYVSAATAAATANWRHGLAQSFRGSVQGMGGFHLIMRWGNSAAATVANQRMFAGLSATVAAIGNVEPDTLNNSVGVCAKAGDANLSILSRNGTTSTLVALGASFPAQTLSADLYEAEFFVGAYPDVDIKWSIKNLVSGAFQEGTITDANAPAQNALMGAQIMVGNGATALAAGIDVAAVSWESDF